MTDIREHGDRLSTREKIEEAVRRHKVLEDELETLGNQFLAPTNTEEAHQRSLETYEKLMAKLVEIRELEEGIAVLFGER
jgi:hypothetical protein